MAAKQGKGVLFACGSWGPVAFFMGVILYASSVPASDIPSLFPFQDVLFHAAVYGALAYSFCRAIRRNSPAAPLPALFASAVLFGLLYGIGDELHQQFIPGRGPDIIDVLIDTIGASLGSTFFAWLRSNPSKR